MRRFVLDMVLLVLLVVTMGYHFLPQLWHEILGLALLAGGMWHLIWNRNWFRAILRGHWNSLRCLRTVLTVSFVLLFLTAMATGILISNYVFRELWVGVPIHRSILIHQLHIASAYAMVIWGGMHIGMHWLALWARIRQLPVMGWLDHRPSLRFWLLVCVGWAGVWASRLDHVGDRLLLKHIFGTPASQLPAGVYYLLLLCLLGLYAIGFFYLQKWLQQRLMARRGGADR